MASIQVVLLNGTTADANEVMSNFNEIYSDIDQTNIGAANKTGSGRFVLDTNPTITGGTFTGLTLSNPILSGTVTGTYNLAGTPTITNPTVSTGTFTNPAINNPSIVNGTLAGTYSGVPSFTSGIEINNLGVDASPARAIDFHYSPTSELNSIWTSVSSIASQSGFTFFTSLGGGSPSAVNSFKITRAGSMLPTGFKLWLDGGGDTYIDEVSADFLRTVVGGSNILSLTSSKVGILNSDPSLHTSTFDDVIIGEVADAATGMALCCDPAAGQAAIRFKTTTGSASSNLLVYDAATNSLSLKSPTLNLGATAVQATINSSGELTLIDRSAPTVISAASQRSFISASGRVVMSTNTLSGAWNVTSTTHPATGSLFVNFTTAFSNANYKVTATCSDGSNVFISTISRSTTQVEFSVANSVPAFVDVTFDFIITGT